MEDWSLGDIINANKSNKLLIIRGTTDEITNINDNNLVKGSVIFDETLNEILLNVGTSSSIDWKNFDTDPIGMTKIWPSEVIPENWLSCNGDAISRTDYSDLFDLLASQYGNGDGSDTFNLPNINNNKFIRASDGDINLGVTGGEERVTLTLAQLPDHTHAYYGSGTSSLSSPQVATQMRTSGFTGGENNVTQSHENRPEFIKSQWIIKVL